MKFLKMETYSWTEKENYSFEFITESFDVYWVNFKQKEEHFTDFCSDCKDIYEKRKAESTTFLKKHNKNDSPKNKL
jgi:hypothetical protein